VFSLEMTSEQLLRRILCIIANVPFPASVIQSLQHHPT